MSFIENNLFLTLCFCLEFEIEHPKWLCQAGLNILHARSSRLSLNAVQSPVAFQIVFIQQKMFKRSNFFLLILLAEFAICNTDIHYKKKNVWWLQCTLA
jgi:hypothetical protein